MIVFVTGASAGFGAAIARSFVKGGHRVVATARRKDRLDALAAELGDALLPIELDVRDADAVAAVPGALPAPDGSHSLYCAVIIKQVDEKTRSKTSVNELLRGLAD